MLSAWIVLLCMSFVLSAADTSVLNQEIMLLEEEISDQQKKLESQDAVTRTAMDNTIALKQKILAELKKRVMEDAGEKKSLAPTPFNQEALWGQELGILQKEIDQQKRSLAQTDPLGRVALSRVIKQKEALVAELTKKLEAARQQASSPEELEKVLEQQIVMTRADIEHYDTLLSYLTPENRMALQATIKTKQELAAGVKKSATATERKLQGMSCQIAQFQQQIKIFRDEVASGQANLENAESAKKAALAEIVTIKEQVVKELGERIVQVRERMNEITRETAQLRQQVALLEDETTLNQKLLNQPEIMRPALENLRDAHKDVLRNLEEKKSHEKEEKTEETSKEKDLEKSSDTKIEKEKQEATPEPEEKKEEEPEQKKSLAESSKSQQERNAQIEQWQKDIKSIKDQIATQEELMSKASPAMKKSLGNVIDLKKKNIELLEDNIRKAEAENEKENEEKNNDTTSGENKESSNTSSSKSQKDESSRPAKEESESKNNSENDKKAASSQPSSSQDKSIDLGELKTKLSSAESQLPADVQKHISSIEGQLGSLKGIPGLSGLFK